MGRSDDVRERSEVVHREPPVYNVDREFWTAEDPDTGCLGLGRIEEEAVGNLLAVVEEYEDDGGTGAPYVKLPGKTVEKTWDRSAGSGGVLRRLRDELGL